MTVRIADLNRPRPAKNRFRISDFHREVIAQLCAYIGSNLDAHLTLDQLAHRVGYSKSHLSRMFRMIHGISIQTYVTEVRMDAAAKLLRDTDMTVMAITHQVGYTSTSGFVKMFMARFQQSPRLYRGTARAAAKRAAARDARRYDDHRGETPSDAD